MNISATASKVLSNKTIEEEVRHFAKQAILSNESEAEEAAEDGDKGLASKIEAFNNGLTERAVTAVASQNDEWFAKHGSNLDSVIAASFKYFYSPRRSENFDQSLVISGIEIKNARIVL